MSNLPLLDICGENVLQFKLEFVVEEIDCANNNAFLSEVKHPLDVKPFFRFNCLDIGDLTIKLIQYMNGSSQVGCKMFRIQAII